MKRQLFVSIASLFLTILSIHNLNAATIYIVDTGANQPVKMAIPLLNNVLSNWGTKGIKFEYVSKSIDASKLLGENNTYLIVGDNRAGVYEVAKKFSKVFDETYNESELFAPTHLNERGWLKKNSLIGLSRVNMSNNYTPVEKRFRRRGAVISIDPNELQAQESVVYGKIRRACRSENCPRSGSSGHECKTNEDKAKFENCAKERDGGWFVSQMLKDNEGMRYHISLTILHELGHQVINTSTTTDLFSSCKISNTHNSACGLLMTWGYNNNYKSAYNRLPSIEKVFNFYTSLENNEVLVTSLKEMLSSNSANNDDEVTPSKPVDKPIWEKVWDDLFG
jgi:hypothetical protein